MNRRDLFSGLTGYSVVVLADQLPPNENMPTPRDFTRIAPPENRRKKLAAEPNMTLVELDCDLMVAGGGLAGVCAAITAARHGAKVVLINDRSRLG